MFPNPDDLLVTFGTEIKYKPDSHMAVGDLVKFGEPDEADFDRDFFTKNGDYDLDAVEPYEHDCDGEMRTVYAEGKSTVYFNHGLDKVIGDHKLGGGLKGKLRLTDKGVWIEARLKEADEYDKMVEELMQKRRTGWSSGVPGHLVKRVAVGKAREVVKWSLGTDASITHTPNDWRNTARLASLKTVAEGLEGLQASKDETSQGVEALGDRESDEARKHVDLPLVAEMEKMFPQMIEQIVKATLLKLGYTFDESDTAKLIEKASGEVKLTDEQKGDDSTVKSALVESAFLNRIVDMAVEMKKAHDALIDDAVTKAVGAAARTPVSKVTTVVQQGDEIKRRQPVDVQVLSPYRNMDAEDMSFLAMFRQARQIKRSGGRSTWEPDEQFTRELADKAFAAEGKGVIRLDEDMVAVVKAIRADEVDLAAAYKSNELNYTTQVGYGAEWIPELWSSQLWRLQKLEAVVSPRVKFIDMPSETYDLPIEGEEPTVYVVAETKNDDQMVYGGSTHPIPPSKIPTAKKQLVARKMAVRVPFSVEFTEDSIIPVLPLIREQSLSAMNRAIDYDVLHADATNSSANITYNGAAQVAGTKHLIGWDGLRHKALVDNPDNVVNFLGSSPTLAKIREMRGKLPARFGMQMGQLAWFSNYEGYLRFQSIPEYLTLDKFGEDATIVTGFLGRLDGIPLYVSDQYPLTDANGYISSTAINNVFGQLLLVYLPAVIGGYRRRINLGMEYLASADAMQVYAHVRVALTVFDNDAVVVGRNIGVS